MFDKTTFALLAAILLSTALPASATTKHHNVPSAAGGGCTASGGPAWALVHHQIVGDDGRAKLLPSPAARVCYCLAAPNG